MPAERDKEPVVVRSAGVQGHRRMRRNADVTEDQKRHIAQHQRFRHIGAKKIDRFRDHRISRPEI
jgi:hypothetical protein